MKNKKGFTLVELLVAITIMGIILIIAIPQVIDIKEENKKTKYVKYADSLKNAAKLYTDSRAKDLFGNKSNGCEKVTIDDLLLNNLAKDFKLEGVTCKTYKNAGTEPFTYINVLKSNDNYYYNVSIKCVDKAGKVVYEKQAENDAVCDNTRNGYTGPVIEYPTKDRAWYNGKKADGSKDYATIKLSSGNGLLENTTIKYAWVKEGTNLRNVTMKKHDFKNKRNADLEEPLKLNIPVPDESGIYKLYIDASEVRDSNGVHLKIDDSRVADDGTNINCRVNNGTGTYNYSSTERYKCNQQKILSALFQVDPVPPTISNIVNNGKDKWTKENVTVTAKGNDDFSGISKIYYAYSESPSYDNLLDSGVSISNGNFSKTWTDSIEKDLYIVAKDRAGNYSDYVSAGKLKIDKIAPTKPNAGDIGSISGSSSSARIREAASGSTDSLSGLKEYRYLVKDTRSTPSKNDSSFTTSRNYTRRCGQSNYAFAIAIDNVGNRSDVLYLGSTYDDEDIYSSWTSCSKSCGGGTKTRTNSCDLVTEDLSRSCNTQSCCSDTYIEWGDYSECDAKCGGGEEVRYGREYSRYNGEDCGLAVDSRTCNDFSCCDDTRVEYGSWDSCSADCDGGTRGREVRYVSKIDGTLCYNDWETEPCNTHPCAAPVVNCDIHGSTLQHQNYYWQCTCGQKHNTGYMHYCRGTDGVLYNMDTNPGLVEYRFKCPRNFPHPGFEVVPD